MSRNNWFTKLREKRFVWFSAISFGAIFSLASFSTGATNLAELMIYLGLRTSLTSSNAELFSFDNIHISAQTMFVENLPAAGIAFRGLHWGVGGQSKNVVARKEGLFRHPQGLAVASGRYIQTFFEEDPADYEETSFGCNVVAQYRFGIPIYDYHVYAIYAPREKFSIRETDAKARNLQEAEKLARERGWDGSYPVILWANNSSEFIDAGWTFYWNYCDQLSQKMIR